MIARTLSRCITCKKFRGKTETQHMANLPPDRLGTPPPFTNVGFDVFGPWLVRTRKLRGDAANAKRWGLVFTCLNSRAIHIEVLETMETNSFLCALRRFFSIRGPPSVLRCDRGTNFVGAKIELDQALQEMDKNAIARYVTTQNCEWLFNPRTRITLWRSLGKADWDDTTHIRRNARTTRTLSTHTRIACNFNWVRVRNMLLAMKTRPLLSMPGVLQKISTQENIIDEPNI